MATQEKTWNVANRLHSQKDSDNPEVNHIIAGADEIYDDAKGAKQSDINAQTDASLADRYTKSETYSKEQLDSLITTPDVNYVSVVATDATTDVTDVLPATGEANTIYRVGNWDGAQHDPTMYALCAWNGTTYVCLAVRSFVGEVYDISVNHPDGQGNPTPYSGLTAALGTNGANIPADIRRGGMSIKFIQGTVQSSDNKYVQYRYMGTEITGNPNSFLNTANWQGVDDEPTAGSNNLVKSGGVINSINKVSLQKGINTFVGSFHLTGTGGITKKIEFQELSLNISDLYCYYTDESGTLLSGAAALKAYYSDGTNVNLIPNKVPYPQSVYDIPNSSKLVGLSLYIGASAVSGNSGDIKFYLNYHTHDLDKSVQNVCFKENGFGIFGELCVGIQEEGKYFVTNIPDYSGELYLSILDNAQTTIGTLGALRVSYDDNTTEQIVTSAQVGEKYLISANGKKALSASVYIGVSMHSGTIGSIFTVLENKLNTITNNQTLHFTGSESSGVYVRVSSQDLTDRKSELPLQIVFDYDGSITNGANLKIVYEDSSETVIQSGIVLKGIYYVTPDKTKAITSIQLYIGKGYMTGNAGNVSLTVISCSKLDISYKLSNNLFDERGSHELVNPDWINAVNTIQKVHSTKFVIGVQSDTHFNLLSNSETDNPSVINNMKILSSYVGLDCVMNLGDLARGYQNDTIEETRTNLSEVVKRYVYSSNCPVLLTVGNHDDGSFAVPSAEKMSKNELYARIIAPIKEHTPLVGNNASLYYYVDFDNIRIIMLNSQDSDSTWNYVFSQEQINWFVNVALDTTKQIIVTCHSPMVNTTEIVNSNVPTGSSDILAALTTFKNNGGIIIGCLYGHTHKVKMDVVDNIQHVVFNAYGNNGEILLIDTVNRSVSTIGIRNGGSRNWAY